MSEERDRDQERKNITVNLGGGAAGCDDLAVGDRPPERPRYGELWVDTSSHPPELKVFSGKWDTIGGCNVIISQSEPEHGEPGQIWVIPDNSPPIISVYRNLPWGGGTWDHAGLVTYGWNPPENPVDGQLWSAPGWPGPVLRIWNPNTFNWEGIGGGGGQIPVMLAPVWSGSENLVLNINTNDALRVVNIVIQPNHYVLVTAHVQIELNPAFHSLETPTGIGRCLVHVGSDAGLFGASDPIWGDIAPVLETRFGGAPDIFAQVNSGSLSRIVRNHWDFELHTEFVLRAAVSYPPGTSGPVQSVTFIAPQLGLVDLGPGG